MWENQLSFELIKSINSLIKSGIGERDRLEHILSTVSDGKYLYLSDKNYLETLLQSIPGQNESSHIKSEDKDVTNEILEELRSLNKKVEQIEATKFDKGEKEESKPTASHQDIIQEKPSEEIHKKRLTPKNEDLTLSLSVVLGLVGLSGISHIYLNKIAKGAGIIIISFMLIGSSVYFLSTNILKNELSIPIVRNALAIILIVSYLGLYIYQILDARKLCLTYNAYVTEHGVPPPWW